MKTSISNLQTLFLNGILHKNISEKILSNPERLKYIRMGGLENKLDLGKYNIKVEAYILIHYIIFTFYILLSKTNLFVSWFCFDIEFPNN